MTHHEPNADLTRSPGDPRFVAPDAPQFEPDPTPEPEPEPEKAPVKKAPAKKGKR